MASSAKKKIDYDLLNEGLFSLLDKGQEAESKLKDAFASGQDLPDDEARTLVEAWQTGREARKALFYVNRGLVADVVRKKFRNTSISRQQLRAAGDEGLIKAIRLFDVSRGAFAPFAKIAISDAITTEVTSALSSDRYGSGLRLAAKARKNADERVAKLRAEDPAGSARVSRSLELQIMAEELDKLRVGKKRAPKRPEDITAEDKKKAGILLERLRQSASIEDSVEASDEQTVTKGDAIEDASEALARVFYEDNFEIVEKLRDALEKVDSYSQEQFDYLSRTYGLTEDGKQLSPEEISDLNGMPVRRIKKATKQGLDLLRELLQEAGVERGDIEWTLPIGHEA